MAPAEREAFLSGAHVGALSFLEPGRGPLGAAEPSVFVRTRPERWLSVDYRKAYA